jgi:hypothetical protein
MRPCEGLRSSMDRPDECQAYRPYPLSSARFRLQGVTRRIYVENQNNPRTADFGGQRRTTVALVQEETA